MKRKIVFLSLISLLVLSPHPLFPDKASPDYNSYYYFPLAFGIGYKLALPEDKPGLLSGFTQAELNLSLRKPWKSHPWFQPGFSAGLKQVTSHTGTNAYNRWDHSFIFGTFDAAFAYRFSKIFEAAVCTSAGVGWALFYNLPEVPSPSVITYFCAGGGLEFLFSPMYNFCIAFRPEICYRQTANTLQDFNGFSLALNSSFQLRFGDDPDTYRPGYKLIKMENVVIPPVFAAMQSYYVNNLLGSLEITNTQKEALREIDIAFFQAGFMDTPLPLSHIPELKPGERRKITMFAAFNNEVFKTEGVMPLSGEIHITCKYRGKALQQSEAVTYDLYDKNSLIWDDDRKAAAFITPADRIIKTAGSFINQSARSVSLENYDKTVQSGMAVYLGMDALDCLYQADPLIPYSISHNKNYAVDMINFPRDTIERITGDCDDLTVLYLSLLETLGITTGYITIPGHVFPVFDTGVKARDYHKIHPDREMTLIINGTVWIPVEITLLGNHDFTAAWVQGIANYREWEKAPGYRQIIITREAQELFRPVVLMEKQYTVSNTLVQKLEKVMQHNINLLAEKTIRYCRSLVSAEKSWANYNRLGIACGVFKEYTAAEQAFQSALELNPHALSCRKNLGNLYYYKAEYEKALLVFKEILEELDQTTDRELHKTIVWQLAILSEKIGNQEAAEEYYALLDSAKDKLTAANIQNDNKLRSALTNKEYALFSYSVE